MSYIDYNPAPLKDWEYYTIEDQVKRALERRERRRIAIKNKKEYNDFIDKLIK